MEQDLKYLSRTGISICKLDEHQLVSFRVKDNSFFLQDMRDDYDIGMAIKLKVDNSQNHIVFSTIELCHSPPLKIPDQLQSSLGLSITHDDAIESKNAKLLYMNWNYEPCNERPLNAFLDFFPVESSLSFRGEYGIELITFIPFVRYLVKSGLIGRRTIITYSGMRPHYGFLDFANYVERPLSARRANYTEANHFPCARDPLDRKSTCVYEEYETLDTFRYQNNHETYNSTFFPNQNGRRAFIQNKFCVEWGRGPINYIPLFILRNLLALFRQCEIQAVYFRPGLERTHQYPEDDDASCQYPDRQIVTEHGAIIFQDHTSESDFNEKKLFCIANSDIVLATQGGASYCLASYTGLAHILHVEGPEQEWGMYEEDGTFAQLNMQKLELYVHRNYYDFFHGVVESIKGLV